MAARKAEPVGGQVLRSEDPLSRFLAHLHSNPEIAGERYEFIRQSLITYFRYSGFGEAQDLVDQTIDRAARKLDEAKDLIPFIRGIARHVALETHRKPKCFSLENVPEPRSEEDTSEAADPDFEMRAKCLERCLGSLHERDRELILEYYKYQGAEKIRNKQRLAAALQITLDALGARAFRTRNQLRSCVTQCMESKSA